MPILSVISCPWLTCSTTSTLGADAAMYLLDPERYFYSPLTPSRAPAATRQPCPAWVARTRSVRARHVHVYTIACSTMPSLPCPALSCPALPARSLALPGYRRLAYGGRGRISTGTRPAGGAAPAAAATFSCGGRAILTTIRLGFFRIFFAAGLCTAHLHLLVQYGAVLYTTWPSIPRPASASSVA